MPWDVVLMAGSFFIKLFWEQKDKKAKRLADWRAWVEKRKSQAKMSADLRDSYKRQKAELKKRYETKQARIKDK